MIFMGIYVRSTFYLTVHFVVTCTSCDNCSWDKYLGDPVFDWDHVDPEGHCFDYFYDHSFGDFLERKCLHD